MITMRRFFALPSGVALDATGWVSPKPLAEVMFGLSPWRIRKLATAAAPPPKAADAERRQVTVMFCDLVGSTALSGRLDPEDLRELIGRYHACVAEMVGRFDPRAIGL